MVEFKIRINEKQKLCYMPRWITDNLGFVLKAIPDSVAVLMFSEGADPKDVLQSMEIIKAELLHSLALKKKDCKTKEPEKHE